ncbi:MAG: GGDEF domain-containing protein [Gammaproteobacteria bacterium]|nr:GGDEF domain-containing protein [Gammaproteobacteria bacterium]
MKSQDTHNLKQTLAEQLQISAHEINYRKKLLGFTQNDVNNLLAYKPIIVKHIDGIIKNFYDFMTSFSEVSLIIGDAETLRRLSSAMHRYVLDLFDGVYDENYVNKRLRIGLVHNRIGVPPELYMSGIYHLQSNLDNTVNMYSLGDAKNNYATSLGIKQAIHKILMFDMQFVLDTYFSRFINQANSAREELKIYTESLEKTIDERTKELENLSMQDMLTGLYNQRAFFENLRREISTAERYKESLVLCYFDLNGFKAINDKKGHQAGDDLLTLVGKIVKASLRDADIGCRYGGDEFALILPRSSVESAETLTKRLIENFEAENMLGVSFSMGIAATGPDDFVSHEVLLKTADTEMYKAKEKAKKRRGFYTSAVHVGA